VSAVPGKAGANFKAFVALIDVLREQTQGLSLRSIIEQMLESSGLIEHFRTDREGQDRIENLEELVNAAESFVTQEGFGRDAVALPLDEHGQPLTQSPASQGLDPNAPVLDEPLKPTGSPAASSTPTPAKPSRPWWPSSPTPRWRRATTRPRPGRTPCSS
jgi:DNA helicase-2/ATP-dependent DNA helicase PcrA